MSWVAFLKEFINEDHLTENQKYAAVSVKTERFIWAKRIVKVNILFFYNHMTPHSPTGMAGEPV